MGLGCIRLGVAMAENKRGTEVCEVDGCLNNYTPNKVPGGVRCVAHGSE
jgi:hypothetical protein